MVSGRVRQIIDKLELILLFIEGAVTRVRGQRIPKSKTADRIAAGAQKIDVRHPGRIVIVQVESRNAYILGRRRSQPIRIHKHAITEKAETKVIQPVRPNYVIHSIRDALVPKGSSAREPIHWVIRPTSFESERTRSGLPHLQKAVPAEQMQLFALIAIDAHVEGIVLNNARSRRRIVGRIACRSCNIRKRNHLQKPLCLRRQKRGRNLTVCEFLAVCRYYVDVAVRANTRVKDIHTQVAQIASPFRGGGHSDKLGSPILLTAALIIAENERLVFLNRTAQGTAELVP